MDMKAFILGGFTILVIAFVFIRSGIKLVPHA